MEGTGGRTMPPQVSLVDREIGRAATEFMASSTERRKKSRLSNTETAADLSRKKAPHSINVEAARKSAIALMEESPSFKRLVTLEEQVDIAIMRKQQAIRETLTTEQTFESRVFRLYIFNTYRSQPDSSTQNLADEVPSWSLRLQGMLLPKGQGVSNASGAADAPGTSSDAQPASVPPANTTPSPGVQTQIADLPGQPRAIQDSPSVLTGDEPRCSDVFGKIVIELDKELYPSNNIIEWKRADREPASDGFEVSRAGSKEFTARILLHVDHKPPRLRLSAELAALIGTRNETRSGVFSSLWQYVKQKRLQCVDDRTAIRLDAGLKSLLGPANARVEVVKFQQLFALAKNHMAPADPVVVEYDVKLSGDVVDNQECYDIRVNVADQSLVDSARQSGVLGMSLPHSNEYELLNEKHMLALEKIAHHKKRREFFEGFCANPVQFINHLILSQTRDLKVLGGGTGRNPEEERRSSFYQQQWVHEAVPRYLLRKAIADTAEDTVESGLKGQ